LNKKAGAIYNAPAFSYRIALPFEKLLPGKKLTKIFGFLTDAGNRETMNHIESLGDLCYNPNRKRRKERCP